MEGPYGRCSGDRGRVGLEADLLPVRRVPAAPAGGLRSQSRPLRDLDRRQGGRSDRRQGRADRGALPGVPRPDRRQGRGVPAVTAAARKLTSAVGTAKLTSLIEASHRVVLDGGSGNVYAVRLLMPHFPLGIGKTPKEGDRNRDAVSGQGAGMS